MRRTPYTCTECGRCTSECPANQTGKKLSPRKIMMDTRDRLQEVGKNIDANKGVFTPDSGSKRVFGIIGIRAQSRAYWGRVLPSSTHAWSCMSVEIFFGKNGCLRSPRALVKLLCRETC